MRRATFALIALVVAIAAGGLWWVQQDDDPASGASADGSSGGGGRDDGRQTGSDGGDDDGDDGGGRGTGRTPIRGSGEAAEEIAAQDFPDDPKVLVISVDGLGSLWVSKATTPTLADLLMQGAGTLNARTEVEKTVTLPNHTGMVTGVRVNAGQGGHGVTWNHTSTRSVAPGTESVFSTIDEAGGSSAVFVGKEKFEMWSRAWPGRIDELVIEEDQPTLVDDAIDELSKDDHDLVFLHLAGPDSAGHDEGWGNPVLPRCRRDGRRRHRPGRVLDRRRPRAVREVVVIVTADHGGMPGTDEAQRSHPPRELHDPVPRLGSGDHAWRPLRAQPRVRRSRRDPARVRRAAAGAQR